MIRIRLSDLHTRREEDTFAKENLWDTTVLQDENLTTCARRDSKHRRTTS